MPKKNLEPRRRSRRTKAQVLDLEQEDTDPEAEAQPDAPSKGLLLLTPRNPIRGSARHLRSRGPEEIKAEEQEEEVAVRPVQVILHKMAAKPPSQLEEEQEEDEETEDEETPRSSVPPPVVKGDLRSAMLSLQKLRAKIPEEPRKSFPRREIPKIPTRRPTKLGPQAQKWPSRRTLLLCGLVLLALLLVLGGWYFLGSKLAGLPAAIWAPVGLLKMDWIYSLLPRQQEACQDHCKLTLVESIPVGLVYPKGVPHHVSIYQGWMDLLQEAKETVDIAAFYFTLRSADMGLADPTASQGEQVFQRLAELKSRGIGLRIAVNSPQKSENDTDDLERNGAEVRLVRLANLTGGIVHTKLWVVDGRHVYVGSANMDWRSLTQVKELGVVLSNCSCLAQDVATIFGTYWQLGAEGATLPRRWPSRYNALSSKQHPLRLKLNGVEAEVYISSAPPSLCPAGRTADLDAILSVIDDAREFVSISVMDLVPICRFCHPLRFWPAIDDRLREAACQRKVSVRLLVSCWEHSFGPMFVYLKSLSVLAEHPLSCPIHVRTFKVPSTEEQRKIPFARVNHNKYMVTDRIAYIGTSNWSEDYFINTAGVGLVINQTGGVPSGSTTVQRQLKAVFDRDWDSQYASELSSEDVKHCHSHREAA
ncbi:5'-3' exonuclease PLD3-like [Scyliorhinus torazame]|uniref:5'-3' exonuclease PLD3-like n=1 Tax=Scyliorhinus torazame TaxID=75743 RepID=UPI003B5A5A99